MTPQATVRAEAALTALFSPWQVGFGTKRPCPIGELNAVCQPRSPSGGLFGDAVDTQLASHAVNALDLGGWRAQVTVNETRQLPPGRDCFEQGDVFALPTKT
jgi:hypothetical protein